MKDIKCPYCEIDLYACHDGYDWKEDECHEQQCTSCGKNFVFTIIISYDYELSKADCLNGAEHKLKSMKSWHFPNGVRCDDCDYQERGRYKE